MGSIPSRSATPNHSPSHPHRRRRTVLAALAVLSYGSLFSACETRLRTVVVDNTRAFLLTDVLPNILGNFLPDIGGDPGN